MVEFKPVLVKERKKESGALTKAQIAQRLVVQIFFFCVFCFDFPAIIVKQVFSATTRHNIDS